VVRRCLLILACLLGAAPDGAAQQVAHDTPARCTYPDSIDVAALANAERICLSRLRGLATRSGESLHLTLLNGTTKSFNSDYKACREADTDKCIQYWFRAHLPAHQAVLLQADEYESGATLLVSLRSGNVTTLDGEPNFSPGGQRFAVVSSSEAVDNDIAIYTTASDPPALEFAYTRPEGTYAVYSFVAWDGEARIRLKVYTREKAGTDPKDFDTQAIRDEAGWRLEGPLPGPSE
jgi:hypothetical protein